MPSSGVVDPSQPTRRRDLPPLFFFGTLLVISGLALYFVGILFSVVRLILHLGEPFRTWNAAIVYFRSHPLVRRVIVVDNNSQDKTFDIATRAGARVVKETNPGYGSCVYRCFQEALDEDVELIVLCEGDMTFRANDLKKLLAYI